MIKHNLKKTIETFSLKSYQVADLIYCHANTASKKMRTGFTADELLFVRKRLQECIDDINRELGL